MILYALAIDAKLNPKYIKISLKSNDHSGDQIFTYPPD